MMAYDPPITARASQDGESSGYLVGGLKLSLEVGASLLLLSYVLL